MVLRIAVAAVLLVVAGAAQACSCAELSRAAPARLEDFVDQAERVVHARVASLVSPREARLQVIESFKGSGERLLASPASSAGCGFTFTPGEERVFFVFGGVVNLCGRAEARPDFLERLRKLKVVADAACEGIPRPPRPASVDAVEEAEPPAFESLSGADTDLNLGIGHVRPVREEDRDSWLRRIKLPVFDTPGGDVRLWLTPGSVSPETLVETGYETSSFIALRSRANGWIQIRFGGPLSSGAGWVHRCHLAAATPRLEYESWQDHFSSLGSAPLYFRSWAAHQLRGSASAEAPLVATIPADPNRYGLQVLEFRGDWARVRASVPSTFCVDEKPARVALHEGWVRWRAAGRGPLLWYYTRGC